MEELNLIAVAQDVNNWQPMQEFPKHFPQFSASTIKTLMWKREEKPGLNRCARMVGSKLYINTKLFGMWMAGVLPEQQKNETTDV
ncbi:hypothetical protein CK910_08515 [Aeromonas sp. CA23]|uniref:hypothetical protein n=1 Tax=Aeromonas sp. CA23 TaxID=2033032 RepID=UPI000BFDAED9|nr:hypothetical protein [Aeromonas sp. CA23]ATL98518.1 hypothetical protein CK910_08515 [Aeromonas sp. CA23]